MVSWGISLCKESRSRMGMNCIIECGHHLVGCQFQQLFCQLFHTVRWKYMVSWCVILYRVSWSMRNMKSVLGVSTSLEQTQQCWFQAVMMARWGTLLHTCWFLSYPNVKRLLQPHHICMLILSGACKLYVQWGRRKVGENLFWFYIGGTLQVKVWCTRQETSALNIDMKANICCVKYNPGSSNFVAVTFSLSLFLVLGIPLQ